MLCGFDPRRYARHFLLIETPVAFMPQFSRISAPMPPEPLATGTLVRIYSVDDDGGTYGYVVPPLNGFQIAGPGETLEILGGVLDDRFRTNLALVDTAGFPNGQTQRVRVEIFESGGARIDSFEAQVPNAGGVQLNDVFNARGIQRATPAPVLIRISPAGGSIGAFAAMVDNKTNDPLYLGAALGAQE